MLIYISTYYLCTVVDCDVLDSVENGYIEYSDGTIYLSEATYNCHNGHNLTMSGDVMRTCQGNGLWNGTVPTCNSEYTCYTGILWLLPFKISVLHNIMSSLTVIQCPGLPNIPNGAVDTSGGTNYKCTAVYTCDTGYVLNGNITRTCQEDANWSGSEPTCEGEIN